MSEDIYKYAIALPPRVNGEDSLNELLLNMEKVGGSDLFLLGGSEAWMKLHSKKVRVTKRRLTDKEVFAILQAIYGSNAPAKLGTGTPIDTSHEFKTETNTEFDVDISRHRFRVNAVSCLRSGRQSLTVTLRTIPTTPPTVGEISVEDEIINTCRTADQGLILIVGATGNGKSTLLASIIRDQLEDTNGHRNIVTIESPVEFVYDDIYKPNSFMTQMEVGRHVESFDKGVVNSLRMAPTTILIGEARDYDTVSAALEASVTGHVVYSTVHANSVAETFQRMVSVFPEEMQGQAKYDLLQAIKLVVAQRLIPTIDGRRTAIREFLMLTQEIKEEIIKSDNMAEAVFRMVELYGKPMMKDVEEKFKSGVISEDVYNRQKLNYNKNG